MGDGTADAAKIASESVKRAQGTASAETSQHWIRQIDSALLVLLLTAGAYAIAFEYQAGYLSYFGVPQQFTEVAVRELIISAGAVLGVLFSMLFFFQNLWKAMPKSLHAVDSTVQRRILFDLGLLVFMFYYASSIGASLIGWVFAIGIPGAMLGGELIMPLVTHRKLGSYRNKIEASVRDDLVKRDGPDFLLTLARLVTPGVFLFLVVLVFACVFAYSVGVREARNQHDFLVPATDPSCAVVSTLSEGLLCVGLDLKAHAPNGEYQFLKPEGTKLVFRRIRHLGAWEAESGEKSLDTPEPTAVPKGTPGVPEGKAEIPKTPPQRRSPESESTKK